MVTILQFLPMVRLAAGRPIVFSGTVSRRIWCSKSFKERTWGKWTLRITISTLTQRPSKSWRSQNSASSPELSLTSLKLSIESSSSARCISLSFRFTMSKSLICSVQEAVSREAPWPNEVSQRRVSRLERTVSRAHSWKGLLNMSWLTRISAMNCWSEVKESGPRGKRGWTCRVQGHTPSFSSWSRVTKLMSMGCLRGPSLTLVILLALRRFSWTSSHLLNIWASLRI